MDIFEINNWEYRFCKTGNFIKFNKKVNSKHYWAGVCINRWVDNE